MSLAAPPPATRGLAPAGFPQFMSRAVLNSNNTPRKDIQVYNNTGSTLTVGGLYRLSVSGAAATTQNPQVGTPSNVGGGVRTYVVAVEEIPNASWGWACAWGYVDALVEGTTDVTIDDSLKPVAGQIYLVKDDSSPTAVSVAEALAGQTANSSVLTRIFLRAEVVALDSATLQYSEVSLSNTNMLALRATPITLVAAPGTGRVIEFVSAQLFFDYTAAYTETTDNLAIRMTGASGTIVSQAIEATGFVDATADTMINALPKIDAISAKTACDNALLCIHNTGDGEWGGGNAANVVRVKTWYRIHAAGW